MAVIGVHVTFQRIHCDRCGVQTDEPDAEGPCGYQRPDGSVAIATEHKWRGLEAQFEWHRKVPGSEYFTGLGDPVLCSN